MTASISPTTPGMPACCSTSVNGDWAAVSAALMAS